MAGAWRQEGFAKQYAQGIHLSTLRQRLTIGRGSIFFWIACWCIEMWTWTRRCLPGSWAGRFMTGDEDVINISREVHINDALMWEYEWGGSSVSCSHLRAAASGEVRSWMNHVCWTTGGEVRRVELRAERFEEVEPRAGRFVEAWYILGPWSSNCMVCLGL